MGYQLSDGLGRASVQGWVWQPSWKTGYLPWGLYQISKYIKNDMSCFSLAGRGVTRKDKKA